VPVEHTLDAPEGDAPTPGPKLRFLSQVRATYLLCEGDDGLYIVDQHAASEQVLWTRLSAALWNRDVPAQALLFPLTLELTQEETLLLEGAEEDLRRVGFDLRLRGERSASLHSVPRLLQGGSPEQLVRELLQSLQEGDGTSGGPLSRALCRLSCHGALRAGVPLSPGEAQSLLRELSQVKAESQSPHGRPILAFTSWQELDRKVGRR